MAHTRKAAIRIIDELQAGETGLQRQLAALETTVERVSQQNADLLAALRGALPYLEHSLKFYRFQRPGHEFWPNREEAEGNIRQARAAIERAS